MTLRKRNDDLSPAVGEIRPPLAFTGESEYFARYRNNIIQRDDISILHDQSPLQNGDVPHPARDGYIRAARLPVIAHPMPSLRMERSAHRRKVSASSGIT